MKRTINKLVNKLPTNIKYFLLNIYDFFFYKKNRKTIVKNKNYNDNNVLYVIRPRDNTIEGLMSLILNTTRHLKYCEDNCFLPYYDFSTCNTQYSNGKDNVWEYFFEQYVSKKSDCYKEVIYSNLVPTRVEFLDSNGRFEKEQIDKSRNLVNKYIKLNIETIDKLKHEIEQIDINRTLGLYLRGTDYINLKPIGHPKQPQPSEVYRKIDEYLDKYNLDKIFLVTEDFNIYNQLLNKYKSKIKIATFDAFIANYKEREYLSKSNGINELSSDTRERGMNYLTKILVLSKLNYLIAGNTCGSWAAMSFSKGYKDYYIYDLGNY